MAKRLIITSIPRLGALITRSIKLNYLSKGKKGSAEGNAVRCMDESRQLNLGDNMFQSTSHYYKFIYTLCFS